MVLPFVIGGLASVASSIIGAQSARKAAKAQQQAAQQANVVERQMYDQTRADFQPFADTGRNALSMYSGALGIGGDPNSANSAFATFRNTPGYQAQMQEGQRSLDMSAANRGGLFSGARQKAGIAYNAQVADRAYGDWMSGVSNLASMGQQAAGAMGNANNAFASRYGGNLTAAGNARAQGYLGQGQAIAGGLQDVAGLANYYRPWQGSGSIQEKAKMPPSRPYGGTPTFGGYYG